MPSYKVLTGIDYPPNKRAEIGDVVSDIPTKSVKWLLDQGIIEVVGKGGPVVEEPVEEPVAESEAEGDI